VHTYKKALRDTEDLKRRIAEKVLQFISGCMFYKEKKINTEIL